MSAAPRASSTVLAPAKVNLRLEIVGRRPDGFHELRTWMLAVDLMDRLRLVETREPGIEVRLSGPQASPGIPLDERNLALRSIARGLEHARDLGHAVAPGLVLELEKHIPIEAGLGGASSDAAAGLWALEELLGVDLGASFRRGVLAELGSDCVFFEDARETGLAVCTGRGEVVEPLPAPGRDLWVALLQPSLGCPTPLVYRSLEYPLSEPPGDPNELVAALAHPGGELRPALFNHLEAAALRAVPALVSWRQALDRAGAQHFRLSGSGSSFFSLSSDEEAARRELASIRESLGRADLFARGSWILKPAQRGRLRNRDTRDA